MITLKQATTKDIPTLIEIEDSVSGSKLYSPMLTEKDWLEALSHNSTYFIDRDGKIVGEVSYEMKAIGHAYIDGLVTIPKFQSQGIAREAMKLVLDKLQDVLLIDLVTHPENEKAIKLYESLGFKIESRLENYFGDGEPRVRMVLRK